MANGDSGTNAADVDVLIVGAGLSGIGAAAHLTMQCPGKSYTIIEQRADMGGTWDLFRYPGIRSDSDMHTLGYRFKPWLHKKTIADGPAIHEYVHETADEYAITKNIRFGHRVLGAEWSSADAAWTVTARREEDGAEVTFRANFLFMCAGYYNYDEGYKPDFPGEENFKGTVIHPQHWPEDLDYAGKRVLCDRIGSDGGNNRSGNGANRCKCDDAATLADLYGVASGNRRLLRILAEVSARESGLRHHPLAQYHDAAFRIPASPQKSGQGSREAHRHGA